MNNAEGCSCLGLFCQIKLSVSPRNLFNHPERGFQYCVMLWEWLLGWTIDLITQNVKVPLSTKKKTKILYINLSRLFIGSTKRIIPNTVTRVFWGRLGSCYFKLNFFALFQHACRSEIGNCEWDLSCSCEEGSWKEGAERSSCVTTTYTLRKRIAFLLNYHRWQQSCNCLHGTFAISLSKADQSVKSFSQRGK